LVLSYKQAWKEDERAQSVMQEVLDRPEWKGKVSLKRLGIVDYAIYSGVLFVVIFD